MNKETASEDANVMIFTATTLNHQEPSTATTPRPLAPAPRGPKPSYKMSFTSP